MTLSERIKNWYTDLREKMRSMSFRQKISYIFTYYKGWILGLLLIALLGAYVGDVMIQRQKETVLQGFFVNDVYKFFDAKQIEEELSPILGLQKNQNIVFDDELYIDTEGGARDISAASNGKIIAYMAVGELDLVVCSEELFQHFSSGIPMADLSEILGAELFGKLSPYILEGKNELEPGKFSDSFPAALELSQCRFIKDEPYGQEESYYLFVPYSAPHRENVCKFIDYIFS